MMLLNIFLFLIYYIVYSQCTKCKICIIDSICDDDYIHFNISISHECQRPIETYFSYNTEIDSEKHYLNKTIHCQDCHVDLTLEPIRDAWYYTLTLVSPEPNKSCSMREARCGGNTTRYVWIITASLSGLFILLGVILCSIRYYRTRKQIKNDQKAIQAAVIND